MAVNLVAAAAFHWFGVAYAAGDPVDTTGWSDRAIAQLVKKAPVVAAPSGGSVPVSFRGYIAFPSSVLSGSGTIDWTTVDLSPSDAATLLAAGVTINGDHLEVAAGATVALDVRVATDSGSPLDGANDFLAVFPQALTRPGGAQLNYGQYAWTPAKGTGYGNLSSLTWTDESGWDIQCRVQGTVTTPQDLDAFLNLTVWPSPS